MKSKVIIFSILLFCSKFVDSIPHSEDLVRQRVNPLSNWQVNHNAPNAKYLDNDFTQTRNVNIQQEKAQDDYSNQGRYNYDNGYNRNPASSSSVEKLLVSYDSPVDGRRLDSYPSRVESYPSHPSQVGFANQQYQNQNWRSQNQYTNSAPSAVVIPDVERPLVTTVEEPYRGPVQYVQPKYLPSLNRRFYQPGRTYLTRNQFQNPLTGDSNYVANSAPRFGSSGPVPNENYVIATDTLTDQSENIKYLDNYKSGSDLSNTAPITNYDDSFPVISEADNKNSDSIPSNLAHVNSKKEAPVDISKILSEKLLAHRYANNYRSDFGWSDIARDDSFNGAPEVAETVRVKSGKYESDYGPKEPVPINTYSGTYSAPTDTELVNSGSYKHEESNVAHDGSSSTAPLYTNLKQNVYHKLTSGITEFNLGKNILAGTNKRFVVIHPNGTITYSDKADLNAHQNAKLRLVNTKRKNIDDSDSDGVLTQLSPEDLPNNIAKSPVPLDEYLLPTNNQPMDDKKPSPLHVDQENPADEYDSSLSPPLKDLPSGHSNLKPLSQLEKQPADNNNSKLLPSYVIPPADDDNSTSLSPNEDQLAQNDNLKPLPQDVNQPGDDNDSNPLTPHVNESAVDGNSKPLPQDGNQPADDDNSKLLTSKEDQQADDDYSKLDQLKDENNLSPNATQPAHSYVKHPANYNNSEPLPTNENQPDDDRSFHPYRKQPANYNRLKHSHVNLPADNNNSNTSSPGENQPTEENQSGDDNDFKPLRPNENQPIDVKSKTNPAVASKNDDQSNSTAGSPTVPNYTTSSKPQVINTHKHKHKHIHRKSATNSPVVNTTPCPDDVSEDQITTLSPIEQTTDNVSDVPPETTTTTTTSSVITPGKSDTTNDANNKQDDIQDDTAQTYSTTTLSPSSSTSPTDNIRDDKTIGTIENKNTQTNGKTVVDQVNNGKKDTQTAVYNSSELFDTNTDDPAESDDYSSVTASPSVQNDVNTGDAPGDNSLALIQSETDVIITASSSTANDSEDEIITISIEVLESTDDAASSGEDKSLVVSIDTNDDSDDDSKTPKPEDCKKDHNGVGGRGKNVEIDMSSLKEPTMWIRTTKQDFIDKLTAKNETEFGVIYFLNIDNHPVIEREKATTIYCNGTVVTEITEVTYANKDDPTPTIVKSTKTMQLENHEADEV